MVDSAKQLKNTSRCKGFVAWRLSGQHQAELVAGLGGLLDGLPDYRALGRHSFAPEGPNSNHEAANSHCKIDATRMRGCKPRGTAMMQGRKIMGT